MGAKKKLIASSLALGCLAPVALVGGVFGVTLFSSTPDNEAMCGTDSLSVTVDDSSLPGGIEGMDDEQLKNAAIILRVGQDLDIPARGQLIALMVAMQESTLHNLNGGDRDSVGLFQQRPSQGWGKAKQLNDPGYAARAFYTGVDASSGHVPGLKDIKGWESLSLNDAAQRVQQSGYPLAYGPHEGLARKLVSKLSDVDVDVDEGTPGAALCQDGAGAGGVVGGSKSGTGAVAAARTTLNQPYVFGAGDWDGPNNGGQDCSGLTTYSYQQAGIHLPRTARDQWAALRSYEVKPSEMQPGDLIFESWGRLGTDVSHVAIYIGDGKMIEASRSAGYTKISDARTSGSQFVGAARVPKDFKQ